MPSETERTGQSDQPWKTPLALVVVLVVVVAWRATRPETTRPTSPAAAAGEVRLTIDFGDGEPLVALVDGRNALEVLYSAKSLDPRCLPEIKGQEANAMVVAIGPYENNPSGHNWTVEVNDAPLDRSAAIAPVKPGDRVLWKYAARE